MPEGRPADPATPPSRPSGIRSLPAAIKPVRPLALTVADLMTSDCLLQVGDIVYPRVLDPDAPPVVVADTRPPKGGSGDIDATTGVGDLVEVVTSTGRFYAPSTTPALIQRTHHVDDTTTLLISRRASLHAALCGQGFTIQRRTPVTFDNTAHPVTAQEWTDAALVIIDGYLLGESVAALWRRGDLIPRPGVALLCTDPDDPRTDAMAHLAQASTTVVLPYDGMRLVSLMSAATGDQEQRAQHPHMFPAA